MQTRSQQNNMYIGKQADIHSYGIAYIPTSFTSRVFVVLEVFTVAIHLGCSAVKM